MRARWEPDVRMEAGTVAARGDVAGADDEVTEVLALLPLLGVSRKQRIERRNNASIIKILGVKFVHA